MIQSINETTGKIVLLYVLDKMECDLTEDTIIDMCYYQNKWISYFTCKIALSELTKSGYISEHKNTTEQRKYYKITNDGRNCLSYFFNEIPTSMRDNIADFIRENKLLFKRKQEYFSDSFKNKDGSYTVILKIMEPDTTNLEVKLSVPEQQTARDIQKNWQDSASKVYSSILETLLNN